MSSRKPIIGGNWKMNTTRAAAVELARGVVDAIGSNGAVDVVICPPFPYLLAVGEAIAGSNVMLAAQDVSHEPKGAFTGEVSTAMLLDCGCTWTLTGHSERRHVIGEPDELINQKTLASLAAGLNVILCVGETEAQRKAGETDAVNIAQLRAGLAKVSDADMARVVIAYEPVWAIGTGLTSTPEDAQNAHAVIRAELNTMYGPEIAASTRIQYGGSVKPSNAEGLFAQQDLDGGLIGGASLNAGDFAAIVAAAGTVAAATG